VLKFLQVERTGRSIHLWIDEVVVHIFRYPAHPNVTGWRGRSYIQIELPRDRR
jgi:hypothetical protein